jgi:hypothetical protein
MKTPEIIEEEPGFYRIIALKPFRETQGVVFDILPKGLVPRIDSVDRVLHRGGALSPGPIQGVEKPWYLHPHQDDNLMVLHGRRFVEICREGTVRVLSFEVSPHEVVKEGRVVHRGGAMLVWPRGVFHRIRSSDEGSASVNFATRYEGFDIRTNFSIHELDAATGGSRVIREGHLDQYAD